jgi:pimeloyl-ACP methyl ester carboxylesterase
VSISASLGEAQCVQLSGGPISYREAGHGPTVVFVHGLAMNGDLWRNVVPDLVGVGMRCITPDWPLGSHELPMMSNADLSPPALAGLVGELLERLDLRDVTLVGNDTGGAICQLVAVAHPDRLARLVLASCDAFEVFPPKPFGYLPWLGRIPGAVFISTNAMRVRALRRLPLAYGMVMRQHPERAISDSYVRSGYQSGAIRRDTKKMLRDLSSRHTLTAAESFAHFTKPVMVAWGSADRLFPRSLAERLTAAFPDSRLEVIDGANTFIAEDEPARLAHLIAGFTTTIVPIAAPGIEANNTLER